MELTSEEAQLRVSLMGAHVKALVNFFETFVGSAIACDGDEKQHPWADKSYMNQLVGSALSWSK